jgi:hypothetical protein
LPESYFWKLAGRATTARRSSTSSRASAEREVRGPLGNGDYSTTDASPLAVRIHDNFEKKGVGDPSQVRLANPIRR